MAIASRTIGRGAASLEIFLDPQMQFFSGFAFLGLGYTIFLQRKEFATQREELMLQREELTLQREDVKLNRIELQRTAQAQELAGEELRAQTAAAQEQLRQMKIAEHNACQPMLSVSPSLMGNAIRVTINNYGAPVSQVWIEVHECSYTIDSNISVLPTGAQFVFDITSTSTNPRQFRNIAIFYRDRNGTLMEVAITFGFLIVSNASGFFTFSIDNLRIGTPQKRGTCPIILAWNK